MNWTLVIHGGAGIIRRDLDQILLQEAKEGLADALKSGQLILAAAGTALDAVEAAVRSMEDNPHFNAGRGSVFSREGKHEFDASIMEGKHGDAGAIGGATKAKNPISLARAVMEKTPHRLLVGPGADQFTDDIGAPSASQAYFSTERRRAQWERFRQKEPEGLSRSEDDEEGIKGTVGAVALDAHGNLAAATSTGGLTNKMPGRVGDSALMGAGTWADNATAAVSCTGHGEAFVRHASAHHLCMRMRFAGLSLEKAAEAVVHQEMGSGEGGLIAVGANGELAMPFSTPGMYRGCANSQGRFEVLIWPAELEES